MEHGTNGQTGLCAGLHRQICCAPDFTILLTTRGRGPVRCAHEFDSRRMKNIEFWSRETDWKILIVASVLIASGLVGLLPVWGFLNHPWLIGTGIAITLLALVWGMFNLLRPMHARWDPRWSVAEAVVVPISWLLLVTALVVCLYQVEVQNQEKIEEMMKRLTIL